MTEEEMPDPGSRASSFPTTCQVFLGWLQGEGHVEPLNQFEQEELVAVKTYTKLKYSLCLSLYGKMFSFWFTISCQDINIHGFALNSMY